MTVARPHPAAATSYPVSRDCSTRAARVGFSLLADASWTASKLDALTVDRQAGEQALDALVIADVSGTIVEWNEGAETVFGYTAEEVIGRALDLVAPEKLRSAHRRRFSAVMAKRIISTAQPIRAAVMHKNGECLEVEVEVTVLRAGNIVNGIGAKVRNVTKRPARPSETGTPVGELRLSATGS